MKVIITGGVLALATLSQAVTILGNMPPVNGGTQSAGLSTVRLKGIGFTMPGTDYNLTSVSVSIGFNAAAITAGTAPILEIWSESGGNPGTVLHTLTAPGGYTEGIGTYTFTPSGGFTLNASTNYYLTMSTAVASASGVDWKADSPGTAYSGLASYTNGRFTTNGGTSWTNSTSLNSLQIEADVVPEPFTLGALALGSALVARRRKRS